MNFKKGDHIDTKLKIGFIFIRGKIVHIFGNGWIALKVQGHNFHVHLKYDKGWTISKNTKEYIERWISNDTVVEYILFHSELKDDWY